MKIRQKLTLQFTILVSLISLGVFFGIYIVYQTYVENRFFTRLRSKAITTAELLTNVKQIDISLLKQINQSNRDLLHKEKIMVFDSLNQEIYRSNDSRDFSITPFMLNLANETNEKNFIENDFKIISLKYSKNTLIFAGAIDLYGNETLRNLRQVMLFLYIVLVVLVALAGWFFSGRALRPISEVITQVNGIYPQSLEKRLSTNNEDDEIGMLTFTFNQLLTRIEDAFKQQRFFITNVSHELKNPLAKIMSQLDVILLKNRSLEEYKQTISSVLEDVQNLSKLSQTLLELSKITADNHAFFFNEIRIDEIIWDSQTSLISSHPNYHVKVNFENEIENEKQFSILGNEHLIKIAFLNLLDNGCKFSENNTVIVNIKFESDSIILVFSNEGKEIDQKDAQLIFQPFFRAENTSKVGGSGIGLSLVDRIIKLHHGTINLMPRKENITSFFVEIPTIK